MSFEKSKKQVQDLWKSGKGVDQICEITGLNRRQVKYRIDYGRDEDQADEQPSFEQEVADYKEKLLNKIQESSQKDRVRMMAQAELAADLLKPHISKIDEEVLGHWENIQVKAGRGKELELVVHVTDVHTGKKTISYNSQVMVERLRLLKVKVIQHAEGLRKQGFKVKKIYVLFGGDIVDGDALYPGHPYGIDSPIMTQIGVAHRELSAFIIALSHAFLEVEVRNVYGNHGRVSKHAHKLTNWDVVLYMLVGTQLENVPRVKFVPITNWYEIVETIGGNIMLTHGDSINMYQNIPLYGMVQAVMKWADSLTQKFSILMIGHFHVPMMMQWNNKTLYVNGAFTSDDDWVLWLLKMTTKPQQRLLTLSSDGVELDNMVRLY